jgi:ABC-2 type transport system ATP-binding protein
VLRELEGKGVDIVDIGLRRPTLDDVFMELTGHGASEEEPA